jgi:hypothetical protein
MRAVAVALLLLTGCASPAALEPSPTVVARPSPTPLLTPSAMPSAAAPGSVTYAVTGDYSATGDLPFIPTSSSYDQNGPSQLVFCSGSCTYEDSSAFLIIGPTFGSDVRFENAEVMLNGACEFTFTRQDESGVAGQFTCTPAQAFVPGTGQGACATIAYFDGTVVVTRTDFCSVVGTATISGAFDAPLQ